MKNIKKLGYAIIAFEGTELLASQISEIRDLVDYVVCGVQKTSYTGEPIDPNDMLEIETLKEEGLIDKILEVELDTTLFPRKQETIKRNLLVDDMAANGCTHGIVVDSDEFYTHDSFMRAKAFIDEKDIEMSYCRYLNYFHDYKTYLVYPFKEGNYVPFIAKTCYKFDYQCRDFLKPSDPTRRFVRPKEAKKDPSTGMPLYTRVKTGDPAEPEILVPIVDHYLVDYYEFPWSVLKMHHFSWIRADIRKKLNTWSSNSYFANRDAIIDKAVDRFKRFSPSNKDESATLLFNTPGNKVDIEILPKQYVNPKYDYKTRTHNLPIPRKIIFLSMTCSRPGYDIEDQCLKETWAKSLVNGDVQGCEFISYKADPSITEPFYDEEKHLLVVPGKDDLIHTYSKSIKAFEWLAANRDFDYIVRTNTTTWINVDLTKAFIESLRDDSIVYAGSLGCCFWSRMYIYGQGNFLIMSKSHIRKLIANQKTDLEEKTGNSDDVLFGTSLNDYYFKANGLNPTKYVKGIGQSFFYGDTARWKQGEMRDTLSVVVKCEGGVFHEKDEKTVETECSKMRSIDDGYHDAVANGMQFKLPSKMNKDKVTVIEDRGAWIWRNEQKTKYSGINGDVEMRKKLGVKYEDCLEIMKKYGH